MSDLDDQIRDFEDGGPMTASHKVYYPFRPSDRSVRTCECGAISPNMEDHNRHIRKCEKSGAS